jgi:hypothetical protein
LPGLRKTGLLFGLFYLPEQATGVGLGRLGMADDRLAKQ